MFKISRITTYHVFHDTCETRRTQLFYEKRKFQKTYSVLHLSQVYRVTFCTERRLLIEHIFLDLHPYSVRALPRTQARRFTVELQFNNCQRTNKILCKKLF